MPDQSETINTHVNWITMTAYHNGEDVLGSHLRFIKAVLNPQGVFLCDSGQTIWAVAIEEGYVLNALM